MSPAKVDNSSAAIYGGGSMTTSIATTSITKIGSSNSLCPVCGICFDNFQTQDMEMHIEKHFSRSPPKSQPEPDLEKEAQKLREQREFEMLRAQYGMDDQGNFREQSAAAMQSAVYGKFISPICDHHIHDFK